MIAENSAKMDESVCAVRQRSVPLLHGSGASTGSDL